MAVATARLSWKDDVSGGKQGTPPEPVRKRNLPDYGPLSARVVCPTGKYLFSAGDEPPAPRVSRGRKMTSVDFQVVAMYSDLTRRDIGYLQSIARVYDVTQMRELIQCRLNHMGKKHRCLDVRRHEDYDVYGGYLEKKYGGRMPELMPLISAQPRRPKVWPRVTEYPVIRSHPRYSTAARKDIRQASLSHPKASAQEESNQRDSTVAVRGSEPRGAKQLRKTSIKKGEPAEKLEEEEEKPAAERAERKAEPGIPSGAGGASTKRSSKTTPAQRKSRGSKDEEGAIGVSSHESAKAKSGPSSVKHGDTRNKDTAKKVSSRKGGEVVSHSKEEEREKSGNYVDMFCDPTATEAEDTNKTGDSKKAAPVKKSVPSDAVDAENRYATEKFEEPTGSEELTPEIAKSMSLEDVEGVFSPEYDEATGQSVSGRDQVKDDALYQEDVADKPAENSLPDEPAEEMDEETVKRLEKSDALAPLWLFEDDDEKVQVFPREDTSPFLEQETFDSERTATTADDAYSKERSSVREETTWREDGYSRVDDQLEKTHHREMQDLTASGDDDYDVIEEVPSCVF